MQSFPRQVDELISQINNIDENSYYGEVLNLRGSCIEVDINIKNLVIGGFCQIEPDNAKPIPAKVIGFEGKLAMIMPFAPFHKLHPKCLVKFLSHHNHIFPTLEWQGRVLNGLCEPIDGKGPLFYGTEPYALQAEDTISAFMRGKVEERVGTGVRAIDTFLSLCKGQRMGVFAGSGVGKSVLLSMLVKFAKCDICVVGLIGERGREVREFIEDTLDEAGLKRTVMVVATSDETALMRREAAQLTLRIAEYYRDQGLHVLCVMDSVTRFAMAQREIGLNAGEPPTTKGYTPSVFAELPRLLERAGPGKTGTGFITGIFTVLVDGDDHDEPIADAVRGILDGHIVLDRDLAARNHYPAINILKSISRTVPMCHSQEEQTIITKARQSISLYNDMADLIRLGAYRKGTDTAVDKAIELQVHFDTFLQQKPNEFTPIDESFQRLAAITA